MFIYFTPDLNVEASEIISRVSIKGLTPGETQNISFVYPIPLTLNAGKYYIGLELDPFKIVNENNEQNIYCVSNSGQCAQFTISNTTVARRKLPYPIIFTHGWTGDSRTWDSFTNEANRYYGWTFGGRLDFCLNPDGTQLNSDNYILNLTKASNITVGDYYYVNFDIATDGELFVGNDGIPFNDDYSNQSAVVKQGWAVREAIKLVLEKTGAEKVILVGHSMGGLASRQYIQNPINWQASGHQVAKLLTIGTPNGGSNASGAALGSFFGYDELSEAVRDLRYPSAFVPGLFLFGGIENSLSLYYNDDVNCNGFVGDNITGLNQKVSPSNIAYSCIVSDYTGLGSDGVVFTNRADINNYLLSQPPLSVIYADKFETTTNHLNIHKENHSTLIQGLDEPYLYDLAYPIKLNTPSMGFITKQANNNPLPPPSNQIDFDDYEFTLEESGTVQLRIWNIPVNDFAGFILNEQYDVIYELQSEGKSNLELDINLTSGKYFFEIGGIPTENSWRFPYLFQLGFTPFSGLTADFNAITAQGCAPLVVQFNNQATGNPTNFTWTFPGGTPSTSTAPNPTVIYSTPELTLYH
ncbi:MAG: alpha/beta fold hydrolase [Saprospiraceae bacterium]|nr:alpha/beta fold hydrolase [Saprospiraceae bacterium]